MQLDSTVNFIYLNTQDVLLSCQAKFRNQVLQKHGGSTAFESK